MLKHFKAYELVDKETFDIHGEKSYTMFSQGIIHFLTNIHADLTNHYGGKVRIVINDWKWKGEFSFRGLRTVKYYDSVKAFNKSRSQHKYGSAIDFDVYIDGKRISPAEIRALLIKWRNNYAITFIENGVNWVHVDTRPTTNNVLILWDVHTGKSQIFKRKIG